MTEIEMLFVKCLAIYLAGINFAAAIATVSDKLKARTGAWRIPEKALLLLGALGGALGEWITMLIIRHKTRHPKFMILLPLFIVLHLVLLWVLFC